MTPVERPILARPWHRVFTALVIAYLPFVGVLATREEPWRLVMFLPLAPGIVLHHLGRYFFRDADGMGWSLLATAVFLASVVVPAYRGTRFLGGILAAILVVSCGLSWVFLQLLLA